MYTHINPRIFNFEAKKATSDEHLNAPATGLNIEGDHLCNIQHSRHIQEPRGNPRKKSEIKYDDFLTFDEYETRSATKTPGSTELIYCSFPELITILQN